MVAQIDARYRSFGLGKTIRRLVSYTFFEGRPHTTAGQWFNPVVFTLLAGLKRVPVSQNIKSPIFIVGLGRSGTTILGTILSLHRDVGYLNEPKAIWCTIDPRHDISGDYVSAVGRFRLQSDDTDDATRQAANRIFGHYLSAVRASRLTDKYPELIFRIDYVLGLFPDAKFVFIKRNGADAVHSIELWSRRLGKATTEHVEDWWGRDDLKWKYLCEQILVSDPYYASVTDLNLPKLPHIDRAALEWIATMREGIEQVKRHPDAILQMNYESLVDNPQEVLASIFSHACLPTDSSVIDYAAAVLTQRPEKPWPDLNEKIEPLFTETMKRLGYSQ